MLKGGRRARALQLLLLASCLFLFTFSLSAFVVGCQNSIKFQGAVDALPSYFGKGQFLTFHATLIPFYLLIGFGLLGCVASTIGLCGIWCLDRGCLFASVLMLFAFLLTTLSLLYLLLSFEQEINCYICNAFHAFVESFYGIRDTAVFIPFQEFYDELQQNMHCCGLYRHSKDETGEDIQRAVLFWTDGTSWGQEQQMKSKEQQMKAGFWVPPTCCKKNHDNCNIGPSNFTDRVNWTSTLTTYWNGRNREDGIWGHSCCGRILSFGKMTMNRKWLFNGSVIGAILFLGSLIVCNHYLRLLIVRPDEDESTTSSESDATI